MKHKVIIVLEFDSFPNYKDITDYLTDLILTDEYPSGLTYEIEMLGEEDSSHLDVGL